MTVRLLEVSAVVVLVVHTYTNTHTPAYQMTGPEAMTVRLSLLLVVVAVITKQQHYPER